jgi:DNA-binding CsgD family transcriptional regulator
MAGASAEQVRRDLIGLLHRSAGVREFSLGAARILGRAVSFDAVCMLTLDPATLLPTGEVVENGLPPSVGPRLVEIEIGGEDVNAFASLARSPRRVASLSEATGRDLNRSLRHRELRGPSGFGDELRVALVDDEATWGGMTLIRSSERQDFTSEDAALVDSVSGCLAEGLRRAMFSAAGGGDGHEDAVGVVVLARDNSIAMTNVAADGWLGELRNDDETVPPVVAAVASRARSIVHDPDAGHAIARARVRAASGRWLLVRGSTLDDGGLAAATIEPARPHELAPLIAEAYGLTARERTVTQLVALGLSTAAIAARLDVSPWTVQDHLKSIFERVGVGSRGELVSRVFFDHFAPRLGDAAPPA